jgi:cation diffusion facilitator CzcD-associated flavoprotein CzcO
MFKIAIVGAGSAGLFALALLPRAWLPYVAVIESDAIGGDLATKYGAVVANITTAIIKTALRSIPRWSDAALPFLDAYADDACPLLADVVKTLRVLSAPDLRAARLIQRRAVSYTATADGAWGIGTDDGRLLEAQRLFLCVGAAPHTMDLGVPAIPLHIALTPSLLRNYLCGADDRVVVFGTAHSGTLALKNLRDAGLSSLTAIYRGAVPFRYARDGDPEGIKQESAVVADSIVADRWANLVSLGDFGAAYRAVADATAVVVATGFMRPPIAYTDAAGVQRAFECEEGPAFKDAPPNVWGFGIAFPTKYTAPNGARYPDVGFAPFIAAIKGVIAGFPQ